MKYKLFVSENCPGCYDVIDALTLSKNAAIELVKVSSARDYTTRRAVFSNMNTRAQVNIKGIPTLEAENGMRIEGSTAILNFMRAMHITS